MKALILLALFLHVAIGASLPGADDAVDGEYGDGDGVAYDGEAGGEESDNIADLGRAAIYGHFSKYAAGSKGQKAKDRAEEEAARERDEEYGPPPPGYPLHGHHPPPGWPHYPPPPYPPHEDEHHPPPGYPPYPPHPAYPPHDDEHPEPPPGYPPHGYPPHPPGWPKEPPPGFPPYPPHEDEHPPSGWPEPPPGYPHHPPGWPPYHPHEDEQDEDLDDEYDYHHHGYPPHHHHHHPPFPPYPPQRPPKKCPKVCDLSAYPDCSCLHPATFTKDGRGNCNVGALKPDLQVWCYVDPDTGDPNETCPDAEKSSTKKGYYWSRFACITE